ncbi:MAG: hypothetical protein R2838_00420 [Caldilineaceae bacterium]
MTTLRQRGWVVGGGEPGSAGVVVALCVHAGRVGATSSVRRGHRPG